MKGMMELIDHKSDEIGSVTIRADRVVGWEINFEGSVVLRVVTGVDRVVKNTLTDVKSQYVVAMAEIRGENENCTDRPE
jgi:hypothetical protein